MSEHPDERDCGCHACYDPPHFPPLAQAQDSLLDQMHRVIAIATRHGEYDAADWIARHFFDGAYAEMRRAPSGITAKPKGELLYWDEYMQLLRERRDEGLRGHKAERRGAQAPPKEAGA